MKSSNLEYVGFWPRMGASLIDIMVQFAVTLPLTYMVYGQFLSSNGNRYMGKADVVINLIFPVVAVIALWVRFGATPGKMAMSAKIVDADTGEPLTLGKSVVRYFAYFVAAVPLGAGFIWVAFDRRKQGWHDKIANSVVVRPAGVEKVRFAGKKDWRDGSEKRSDPEF